MSTSKENNFFNTAFSYGADMAQSFFASRLIKRMRGFLPGPMKIMYLLQRTYSKSDNHDSRLDAIAVDLFEKGKSLGQFIGAYYRNDYRDIEPLKMAMIVAAIAYIISPIDLIPDVIPVIGYMDDLFIMGWLFEALNEELKKFELWADVNLVDEEDYEPSLADA